MQEAVNLWIANAPAKSIEWVDTDAFLSSHALALRAIRQPLQMALAPTRTSAIEREWRTWSFTGLSRLVQEPGSYRSTFQRHWLQGRKCRRGGAR